VENSGIDHHRWVIFIKGRFNSVSVGQVRMLSAKSQNGTVFNLTHQSLPGLSHAAKN
jgi:hypothetical protein